MARHEALREAISSLKTVLSSLEETVALLNKVLPDVERDIGFASNIRKITAAAGNLDSDTGAELVAAVAASGGSKATARAASKAKKTKTKAKSKGSAKQAAQAAQSNGTDTGENEVYAFLKGQGSEGASKKEITEATGHEGDKLRVVIDRLREGGKVKSRGKTNQTRYFAS
jgi:hypothetical protein